MQTYHFFEECLLRTPGFSYKSYSLDKISDALTDPYFQGALLVASPVLYHQLSKAAFCFDQLKEKEKNSVIKYFNRICYRPTPFGLFTNFSVVSWGKKEPIQIGAQQVHLSKSFSVIYPEAQELRRIANIKELQFKINNSVYEYGEELRYIVSTVNKENTALEFSVQSLGHLPLLQRLIIFCATEKSYALLVAYLQDTEQMDSADAHSMLIQLIDLQFLTDQYLPNITGVPYLQRVSELPSVYPVENKNVINIPANILTGDSYHVLKEYVDTAGDVYINSRSVAVGKLDSNYQEDLLSAIDCLGALSSHLVPDNELTRFADFFEQKFDKQSVPLMLALDPETGIAYHNMATAAVENTFTEDIEWEQKQEGMSAAPWSAVHSLLLRKWHEAKNTGENVTITITKQDLDELEAVPGTAPAPTMSVLFRITEEGLLIENTGGASATSLIGRFTPFDKRLSKLAIAIAEKEARSNPGVIFAEISHVCELHSANINRRENCYQYEIPVLTTAGVDAENVIPLNDLWVSVENKQVILYSKQRQRRVIPRLSSAFNYTRNNLTVFKFLCDLQYQGISTRFKLDLAAFFPSLSFYPRVEFGRTILSLASWLIKAKELEPLFKIDRDRQIAAFRHFAAQLTLPVYIALTVNDHQLVFNLEKQEDIFFFLDTVKGQEEILVKEFLLPGTTVNNPQGPVVNHFIASVYHNNQVYEPFIPAEAPDHKLSRSLPTGGKWLYYKIYCHPARSNELLAAPIYSMLEELKIKQLISSWFFIRYNDPDHHIRLRLLIRPGCFGEVLKFTTAELGELYRLLKISDYRTAIYEREMERYGFDKIQLFEHLFYKSSNYVISYFKALENGPDLPGQAVMAFFTVRNLLSAFGLEGIERIAFLEQRAGYFLAEFDETPNIKHQLDNKYRKMYPGLASSFAAVVPALKKAGLNKKHLELIKATRNFPYKAANPPAEQLTLWLADLIHMHLNRLFADEARKQELIVYYLVLKYERGLYARGLNPGC